MTHSQSTHTHEFKYMKCYRVQKYETVGCWMLEKPTSSPSSSWWRMLNLSVFEWVNLMKSDFVSRLMGLKRMMQMLKLGVSFYQVETVHDCNMIF